MNIHSVKKFFKIYSWVVFTIFFLAAALLFYMFYDETSGFTKSLPSDNPGPAFALLGYIGVSIVTLIFYKIVKYFIKKISDNQQNIFYKDISVKFLAVYVILTVLIYLSSGPSIFPEPYQPEWNPYIFFFSYFLYSFPILLIGTLIRYIYLEIPKEKKILIIIVIAQFLFIVLSPFVIQKITYNNEERFKEVEAQAVTNLDPKICDEISNPFYEQECKRVSKSALDTHYEKLAIENGDTKLCYEIDKSSYVYCIMQIAAKKKDVSICSEISLKYGESDFFPEGHFRSFCIKNTAKELRDNTVCENIGDDFNKKDCATGVCYQIIRDYGKYYLYDLPPDVLGKYAFCNETNVVKEPKPFKN